MKDHTVTVSATGPLNYTMVDGEPDDRIDIWTTDMPYISIPKNRFWKLIKALFLARFKGELTSFINN